MKNINLLLPNPLLIYHEKFSPRIAEKKLRYLQIHPYAGIQNALIF